MTNLYDTILAFLEKAQKTAWTG